MSPWKSLVVFGHLQQLVKCACPRVRGGLSLQVCQCIYEIHHIKHARQFELALN